MLTLKLDAKNRVKFLHDKLPLRDGEIAMGMYTRRTALAIDQPAVPTGCQVGSTALFVPATILVTDSVQIGTKY
jgi:hypothetical protein